MSAATVVVGGPSEWKLCRSRRIHSLRLAGGENRGEVRKEERGGGEICEPVNRKKKQNEMKKKKASVKEGTERGARKQAGEKVRKGKCRQEGESELSSSQSQLNN